MKKYILVLFFLFSNIVFGADLEVVARIPLPENIRNLNVSQLYMRRSDCNTKFYFELVSGSPTQILFDTNGFWYISNYKDPYLIRRTNIVGTLIEDGVLKVIQDEIVETRFFRENPSSIYNSISENGFSVVVNESINIQIQRYKISADKKDPMGNSISSFQNLCHLTNYKRNKEPISTNTFSGNSIMNNFSDSESLQFSPPGGRYKHLIAEKVDDYLIIYNLDIDQVKPNPVGPSIRIESSNETGIDAVINSETGKTVRVQSSRDNIDWTDVNTIPNPNGKKIFLPFSQQKEFIRGVE
jgi:hypothetical protein